MTIPQRHHEDIVDSAHGNDSLPAYIWPGGYELVYLAADSGIICKDCANGENGALFMDADPDLNEDAQWTLVGKFVHWEGSPYICEHCNREIESEYGPMEEDKTPAGYDLDRAWIKQKNSNRA